MLQGNVSNRTIFHSKSKNCASYSYLASLDVLTAKTGVITVRKASTFIEKTETFRSIINQGIMILIFLVTFHGCMVYVVMNVRRKALIGIIS